MRGMAAGCVTTLLLWFTGPDVARAEPSRGAGPTARLGSAVGFTQLGRDTVTTLGAEVGLGYRMGPFALEAQLDHATMLEQDAENNSNEVRGALDRWGVNGRVFAPALSWPGSLEPDSVLRLYGEVGGGRQRGEWASGERFARSDVTLGGGWLLDHSMQPRTAMPFHSVGWQMGWQLRASRASHSDAKGMRREDAGETKDTLRVRETPPMPTESDTDLALIVSCSLTASW